MYRETANAPTTRACTSPPLAAPGEPNYLIALLVAASLLVADGTWAFVIARVTAWYARRWRGPRDG